ncbi:MAG: helix-turn-helix transcriptional regulator [Chloroflexi bacterium]|nr:helix-turn-helix transcriptional regulator [Chloroflexota bacterium]
MSVRHAVLGLLAGRPRHGYELRAAFEAVVGKENWDVKPAQIYTTLGRMEKLGLVAEQSVEQDGGPEKRIYAITPAGYEALREWFDASVAPEHQRDEFYIKLMLGLVTGAADPSQLINAQRGHLYRQLHAITAQRTRVDPAAELARLMLLEKAAMHLEADLRWLDLAEARLDEIRQQPLPEPDVKPRGRPRKQITNAKPAITAPHRR